MDYGCSETEQLQYEYGQLEEQIERLEREKAKLAKVEIRDGEVVIPKGEVERIKAEARAREKRRQEAEKQSKEAGVDPKYCIDRIEIIKCAIQMAYNGAVALCVDFCHKGAVSTRYGEVAYIHDKEFGILVERPFPDEITIAYCDVVKIKRWKGDSSSDETEQLQPLKRYWLFSGRDYENLGGMADFYDRYNFVEIAQVAWETEGHFRGHDWAHILDSLTGDIVTEGRQEGRYDTRGLDYKTKIKWTEV